ncbi:MAG: hypothetical protein CK532_06420 [Flavobacteriales bacterium]|nr:MAG: hypothetical protein CK532_06420 [Flavobacteriales bacterium]
MNTICKVGDIRIFSRLVSGDDLATFNKGNIHPFYATFALGRDVEWACRQFVLEMKDEDEEGIGTFLNIVHKSPAFQGESVEIRATLMKLQGNDVHCAYCVFVGERLIAEGSQGQKILKKEKIQRLIEQSRGH